VPEQIVIRPAASFLPELGVPVAVGLAALDASQLARSGPMNASDPRVSMAVTGTATGAVSECVVRRTVATVQGQDRNTEPRRSARLLYRHAQRPPGAKQRRAAGTEG